MEKPWKLFIDGSSCRAGGDLGIYLTNLDGQAHHYLAKLIFKVINNEAKYEALVVGLGIAAKMGVTKIMVKADSQVVVNQILGNYASKSKKLRKYRE